MDGRGEAPGVGGPSVRAGGTGSKPQPKTGAAEVKVDVGPGLKAMMSEMERHRKAMEDLIKETQKPGADREKILKKARDEATRHMKKSSDIRKKYPMEACFLRQAKMSDEARELQLYIENDGQLYRQQFQPIIKNLMTKRAQGKYDSAKAVKLFMYLMDNGAKKYHKEMGSPGQKWMDMFPKSARLEAAKAFVEDFESEAEEGSYDEYIPKKYQKKGSDVEAVLPMKGALVLEKFPSGRWGFVGSVPVPLYWQKKDGSEIPPEEAKEITQSSNPSMYAKTKGIERRVFKSKEEALSAAKKAKAKITQVVGDVEAALPPPAEQLKMMSANPPRVKGTTVEVFSPVVKKYIPMAEWPDAAAAKKDLASWMEAHKETLTKLKQMAAKKEGDVVQAQDDLDLTKLFPKSLFAGVPNWRMNAKRASGGTDDAGLEMGFVPAKDYTYLSFYISDDNKAEFSKALAGIPHKIKPRYGGHPDLNLFDVKFSPADSVKQALPKLHKAIKVFSGLAKG